MIQRERGRMMGLSKTTTDITEEDQLCLVKSPRNRLASMKSIFKLSKNRDKVKNVVCSTKYLLNRLKPYLDFYYRVCLMWAVCSLFIIIRYIIIY